MGRSDVSQSFGRFINSFSPRSLSPSHVSPSSPTYNQHEEAVDDSGSEDGYDSDATLELDPSTPEAAAFLQGAPPLQRMSRGYERLVLRSISHGPGATYVCACSRGVEDMRCGIPQHLECLEEDEDEEDSDTSGDCSEGDTDGSATEDYFSIVKDEDLPVRIERCRLDFDHIDDDETPTAMRPKRSRANDVRTSREREDSRFFQTRKDTFHASGTPACAEAPF